MFSHWQRRINSKDERAMIQLYLLVSWLQKEATMVNIGIRHVQEQALSQSQRKEFHKIQSKTEKLWDSYDVKEMKTLHFLRHV